MPHPSEYKINVRIQTREGVSAADAFLNGLERLVDIANHVGECFDEAMERGPEMAEGAGEEDAAASAAAAAAAAAEEAAAAAAAKRKLVKKGTKK